MQPHCKRTKRLNKKPNLPLKWLYSCSQKHLRLCTQVTEQPALRQQLLMTFLVKNQETSQFLKPFQSRQLSSQRRTLSLGSRVVHRRQDAEGVRGHGAEGAGTESEVPRRFRKISFCFRGPHFLKLFHFFAGISRKVCCKLRFIEFNKTLICAYFIF